MDALFESLTEDWEAFLRLVPRLVLSLVVLLAFVVAGRLIGNGLVRVLKKGKLADTHGRVLRALTVGLFSFVGILTSLNLLGLGGVAASLLASGGITAIVLGFAFREIGENLLAGLILAFKRPFAIGDLIRSGDFEGEVRSVELRHTHIRTPDATDVFVPNAQIFSAPLVNYTRDGLRRPTVTMGIDYGDDPQRAVALILEATRNTPGVTAAHVPLATIAELGPQYVVLSVSFWVDTFAESRPLVEITGDVLANCRAGLKEAGFTFSSDVTNSIAMHPAGTLDVRVGGETDRS